MREGQLHGQRLGIPTGTGEEVQHSLRLGLPAPRGAGREDEVPAR